MPDLTDDPYAMLYCDDTSCRVNTFEHGKNGTCPSCGRDGKTLR